MKGMVWFYVIKPVLYRLYDKSNTYFFLDYNSGSTILDYK